MAGLAAIISLSFYKAHNTDQEASDMKISDSCVNALRMSQGDIPGSAQKIITECRSVSDDDLVHIETLVNREDDYVGVALGLGSISIIIGAGMMNYANSRPLRGSQSAASLPRD
ncbi:MAG TPA: hypothetical protein VF572_04695 [Candidatus Saccharimonadales bacterium]|jgi:hypothetical protein